MKRGAYDFLTKPVNLDQLELLLQARAARAARWRRRTGSLHEQLDAQVRARAASSASRRPMQEVFDTIRQVAPTRATVLIQGESGTGKELVAHAIHRLSPRAQGPFVAVHCAALSHDPAGERAVRPREGRLHRRRRSGAAGRFELADGGTLFLDEIGEIDPAIQVKLLRVLEERQVRAGGRARRRSRWTCGSSRPPTAI